MAPDPFTAHPSGSASFVTYDAPSPSSENMAHTSTSSHTNGFTNSPRRTRGSILLPSGISLPFAGKRSKSKKSYPPPPTTPFVFSEVIEISAPPPLPPEEEEDRAAAMEGWEELNRKKWRGLGLSDPVKTVEVRPISILDILIKVWYSIGC